MVGIRGYYFQLLLWYLEFYNAYVCVGRYVYVGYRTNRFRRRSALNRLQRVRLPFDGLLFILQDRDLFVKK